MKKSRVASLVVGLIALSLLALGSYSFAQTNAFNSEPSTRVRNCVDLKNGNARLIALTEKCAPGERLVKFSLPKVPIAKPAQLLNGDTSPVDTETGRDGDFYLNTTSVTLYGPRTNGVWGDGISLVGRNGLQGAPGTSLLSGISDPVFDVGVPGDFFLNTATLSIFGPKSARSGWGQATRIVGPMGPTGSVGATGARGETGAQGETGTAGGFGDYGSFYDTTTTTLVINTATPVPLNVTALSKGISIVDGSKITFTRSGNYNLSFSLQIVKLDPGTDEVSIWLCRGVSGGPCTNVPWTNTELPLIGSNVRAVTAWNFFIDALANDYYQLMISSSGTTLQTKLLSGPAKTNPLRPEVPSSIVTVSQIG